MQEKIVAKKEREPKDDGRYIIYYTFGDEEIETTQEDDAE